MNKNTMVGVGVVVVIVIGIISFLVMQPKKIDHTYEPVTDIARIRECVTELTGSPMLDIEALTQNQALFADVYRFCLKTVDDIEGTLKVLAR